MEDRTPVIPNGPSAFDAGCILGVANAPIIHDDELWIYYTGVTTGHGGKLPEKRISIGLATWRRDGMASLEAGNEEGVVETVPLRLTGDKVVINADASRGSLTVELTDAQGTPLPGLSQRDSVPLQRDAISKVAKWQGGAAPQADSVVRLRFFLKNAQLYSYAIR